MIIYANYTHLFFKHLLSSYEGAAIPPNKLSGSSLLYKIIKVDPLL